MKNNMFHKIHSVKYQQKRPFTKMHEQKKELPCLGCDKKGWKIHQSSSAAHCEPRGAKNNQ